MKVKYHAPATQPIASDKPLIPETELARTKRLEKEYFLPPDELAAIIVKYGAPRMPLKNNRNGYYVQRGS